MSIRQRYNDLEKKPSQTLKRSSYSLFQNSCLSIARLAYDKNAYKPNNGKAKDVK